MSTRFSLRTEMSRLTGTGLLNPSREIKFSGVNGDTIEKGSFPLFS